MALRLLSSVELETERLCREVVLALRYPREEEPDTDRLDSAPSVAERVLRVVAPSTASVSRVVRLLTERFPTTDTEPFTERLPGRERVCERERTTVPFKRVAVIWFEVPNTERIAARGNGVH